MVDAGRAKLVYAPQTFSRVYESYGDGGILALLAHALGHTLDDTLGASWVQKNWTPEVRADAWAGCVLARSKLTGEESRSAIAALSEYPSGQHPQWTQRLVAIQSGYAHCGGSAKLGDPKR